MYFYFFKYPGRLTFLSCMVQGNGVHYRRFPLIQGGVEIPVEVTVEMDICEENVLAIEKYKALS